MANRRMMCKDIIDTDKFMDMPSSTQCLYFHFLLRGDDDGFINNPKKIIKCVNCSDDDFKILLTKQYLIPFDTGICVVKDWKIHNYIQKDRYNQTIHLEEKSKLAETHNRSYSLSLDTKCIQTGYTGKISIDKVSEEEDRLDECILSEEKTKKVDPFLNTSKDLFEKEFVKVFGRKPFLSSIECNKIIELESTIEDFEEVLPAALIKLNEIKWEFKEGGRKPSANWLLRDNNFHRILNGEFDRQLNEVEQYWKDRKEQEEREMLGNE